MSLGGGRDTIQSKTQASNAETPVVYNEKKKIYLYLVVKKCRFYNKCPFFGLSFWKMIKEVGMEME